MTERTRPARNMVGKSGRCSKCRKHGILKIRISRKGEFKYLCGKCSTPVLFAAFATSG